MKDFLPSLSPNYLLPTVSTHNSCFCFRCPHCCESRCEHFSGQTLLLHLLSFYTQPRLSFSTCSLFIPSPWCSSLTFIAPVNEILFCCVYSPAVLSLARPRSPSPVYSLRVTSGVIVVQGPCPSTAVGATWSNNHDHMSMYSWFPMAFLTTWLINSRRAKALFILLFSREYTEPPRRRDTSYFRLNK